MTKHKVDMDDYDDSRQGDVYTGKEPTRGIYEGRLTVVKDHTSGEGNEGLEWRFQITKGEFKGWTGYTYSNFDTTKWKTQQITAAITGTKKSTVINTDDDGAALAKKAKPVMLRVITEKYEGEPRAKLRIVLPMSEDADTDTDDDDSDDDPFE